MSDSGTCADRARLEETIVGCHPRIVELRTHVEKLCRLPGNVLILGESGTGKEVVARAIHAAGPRSREPFLAVNCGALSRSLLEDQLFGHARGAFTGASTDARGLFVSAGQGTLFLDEIAELDLDLQVKLLRAIEEREVTPLGSTRGVRWSARLICATNRELDGEVADGRFRRDLYYRINILGLRIPPLRERRDDLPHLVEHFLVELARDGGQRYTLSPAALRLLLDHDWPGNVRELRNVLERAAALGASREIGPAELPAEFRRGGAGTRFQTLEEVERAHVIRALRATSGVRIQAARLLGIDRNRLTRLIQRLGIEEEFPALARGRRRHPDSN